MRQIVNSRLLHLRRRYADHRQTKIIADERANSLLVFASRQDMIMITNIISKLTWCWRRCSSRRSS